MHPYLKKLRFLFTNPDGFYDSVKKEGEYWPILKFYVIFVVAAQVLNVVVNLPMLLKDNLLITTALTGLASTIVLSFAIPFVMAGIVHLGVIIFKGKQGYFNTFKVVTYGAIIGVVYNVLSSIINSVYGWFNPIDLNAISLGAAPGASVIAMVVIGVIIGLVSLFHVVYTDTIGIAKYQGLTKLKAFLAVVLILLILFLIIGAMFGVGLATVGSLFGGV